MVNNIAAGIPQRHKGHKDVETGHALSLHLCVFAGYKHPYLAGVSRYYSYINTTKKILSIYKGEGPLVVFLKNFFSAGKKYGATDRRQISHLCYCYFRLGKALPGLPVEERILTGLFLCADSPNELLQHLKPEWNEKAGSAVEEKFSILAIQQSQLPVFPWIDALSKGIDPADFSRSLFIQPDLFLRLRPGYEETVKLKLQQGGIEFRIVSGNCLALTNSSKVDGLIELDKEAVVQDLNSQRINQFFMAVARDPSVRRGPSDGGVMPVRRSPSDGVWDCCAGSGGKSILLHDLYPEMKLTVSDTRESILVNLEKRFKKAGIINYKAFTTDLSKPGLPLKLSTFHFIIADVPCTGSGTWGRTPEQLYYFDEKKIAEYAILQKQIVSSAIPHVEKGGYFLYITCSVFRKENEEVVDFIRENFHLQIVKMELLSGYCEKADTLFAALLKKEL